MLKHSLKALFLNLLNRDFVKSQLSDLVLETLPPASSLPPGFGSASQQMYQLRTPPRVACGPQTPIFVTSRFRSGSTLLWRCFRDVAGLTAYYEPLNPRRWFDSMHRGIHVDSTHQGVADYWREYDLLSSLDIPWSSNWSNRDLYLSPLLPMERLQAYLRLLIAQADTRPVLQFNRVDFRLHWLKTWFPDVCILHLYRNPRDQWLSTFLKNQAIAKDVTVKDFAAKDEFYLSEWAKDLRRWFPIFHDVDAWHPYELSYCLWRMSFEYGQHYADTRVSYESLVSSPCGVLGRLSEELSCPGLAQLKIADSINTKSLNRWTRYDGGAWFAEREKHVDFLLSQYSSHVQNEAAFCHT